MVRYWIPGLTSDGLNFLQLVEAYAIQTLRSRHRLSTRAIRKALRWLRDKTGYPYPLAVRELGFETDKRSLFVDYLGSFTDATKQGQVAWHGILEAFLERVDYAPDQIASRFYPFTRGYRIDSPRLVIVDPRFNFGRPCLASRAVSTAIIAQRNKAGESREELARDYRCAPEEIDEAIRSELPTQLAA
jgi:uncharacterized protein (DUF433 family)